MNEQTSLSNRPTAYSGETVEKQRDGRANLRPFVAGDPRINRHGRPKNFDAFRRLAQAIAHERITDANGEVMTRVERILRDWSESKDVQKQIAFVQYGYGKPPDKIETNLEPKTTLRLYFAHEEPGYFDKHPDERPAIRGRILPDSASNGEGTRRPLLSDAE
jgi:hypothetical protein